MPDPNELQQFHELTEEIKAMEADSPEYRAFAATINAVDERLTALSPSGRRRPPLVSERDRSILLGAHATISQAAENLLATDVSPELKQKVLHLTDIAAKNYRVLNAYKPAKQQKTLPSLLEDARTVSLDTRGADLADKMSGNQSSRQPISYLDDQGKKITGVFTPKKVTRYWDDVKEIFQKEADDPRNNLSADAKNMLTNFLDNYREVFPQVVQQNRHLNVQKNPNEARESELTTMISGITNPSTGNIKPGFLENAFKQAYPQLQGQDLRRIFGKGMMQRLSRKIDEKATSIGIQVDSAGIREGSRTDNRNAAMYAAAELLGVPHLIAKTIPMKLIGGNGQEIEGTFMMKGKGMDPNNLPDEALDINERALTGTNGKGFKDLADLQVLDYICGNVDRHGGNMFYQFDRNGKFCGVQGIDNDCAFGLLVPKGNRNVNKMVGPEYMKIVSRSMYNKVMDLTPAELRFALRGFALSEKELHCAVRRTQKLQEELKKGTVKVVEDKDFKKIGRQQLDQLRVRDADGSGLNLFARAFGMIKTFGIQRSSQKKLYQDLDDMTALREQNRALPGATAREEENADLLLDQMALVTKTGWWRFHKGTSPQFEAMRQSVRNYKEYQQRIRSRIDEANTENRKNDPDAPIDAMVTKEELEEMARLRKDMREKADTYLEGRQNVKYNSYTNMRKEIARMVKAYGSAGETVSADEIRTQEKQMKRAVEESDRRLSQQQKEHQNGPVAGL